MGFNLLIVPSFDLIWDVSVSSFSLRLEVIKIEISKTFYVQNCRLYEILSAKYIHMAIYSFIHGFFPSLLQ